MLQKENPTFLLYIACSINKGACDALEKFLILPVQVKNESYEDPYKNISSACIANMHVGVTG